jgi:hypothetical protein
MMDENRPPISGPASAGSILTLILNLIVPGLGTIVGGNPPLGVGQLALALAGIPILMLLGLHVTSVLLAVVCAVGAWIWGIITGVKAMARSSDAAPANRPPDFH